MTTFWLQVMRWNETSMQYYLNKGAINMSLGPEGYIDFRQQGQFIQPRGRGERWEVGRVGWCGAVGL
jgi:hypothetical protein